VALVVARQQKTALLGKIADPERLHWAKNKTENADKKTTKMIVNEFDGFKH
jgi:hypothetical protein